MVLLHGFHQQELVIAC